jgi:hypothetical protein
MLSLFSGSDDDIMAAYGSQEAVYRMKATLEATQDHCAALMECKRQFEEIAANDATASVNSGFSGFSAFANRPSNPSMRPAYGGLSGGDSMWGGASRFL